MTSGTQTKNTLALETGRDPKRCASMRGRTTAKQVLNNPREDQPDSAPRGTPVRSKQQFGFFDALAYQRDVLERTILFFDTLRRRANNMLDHERAGLPPLLNFKYEMLLDARQFECPVNYALLRITEIGDDCWDDCVDPAKPPVIIIDPRAGHGPGMGGFKRESEVGVALHTGHPVYFIAFFPEPSPHQTLPDVLAALRQFVEDVAGRHDGNRPVLYGNCQGGWAATLLSAHCESSAGLTVLNGSPLSYWEGEPGVNPMRVLGGFVGGVWLAHLLSDLNDDRFDGAWLVHSRLGFNYRLSDVHSAIGVAQLERLTDMLDARARVAGWYQARMAEIDGVTPMYEGPQRRSWFVYAPRLAPAFDRDEVIGGLDELGISAKPYLPCIHLQPYYQDAHGHGPGEFPVTEAISASTIALPFFPEMTEAQVDRVCGALDAVLRR